MKKSRINEIEFEFYNEENLGSEGLVFMKMPKVLFFGEKYEKVTTSAKMLYMLLLDRTYLSMKNKINDEEGRVYIFYTQAEAKEVLQCGSCKINQLYKELESNELIFRIKQGLNKADIIYVKNLSKIEVTETGYNGEYQKAYTYSNIQKNNINSENVETVENFQHSQKMKVKTNEKNNSKVMENETIEFQKTKVQAIAETNDYVENYKNVENFEENEKTTVLTYEKNISGLMENETQELSKPQTNNNKLNNNKINNNKSIISSSEVENLNSKKDDDDDCNNILTIKHLNSTTTTKDIIKKLIPTNAIKDTVLKDLFINSLTSILTSKKYQNNKKETYNKLFNLKNKDKILLNDLAKQSVKDFVNGNAHTNIVYPISYMCSCILNILDYGITETVKSVVSNKVDTFTSVTNSCVSYDIAYAEELLNTVPRLV